MVGDPGMGGSTPLLRWWNPGLRDAAGDTLQALPLQRGQSRELARTNPIAAGALQTNVDRVVGTGLVPVFEPALPVLGWTADQAEAWKATVAQEWSLWADSPECDLEGELNFYDKQGLTLRSALESGDAFTLLPDGDRTTTQPYRLRLQTIEADRVGNPRGGIDTASIAGGVRRGSAGVEAYHVYARHPGALAAGGSFADMFAGTWIERIGQSGRRRMLHHYRVLRPGQPRGVPYLAPVVEALKQLGRYSEAELQAAVVAAFFTVFVESPTGSPAPIFGASEQQALQQPEVGMAPGAVVGLAPGETAKFADPTRPNPAFESFVQAVVQQIGVGLAIPAELLMKRFNASYSASRAALLDAWVWFRSMRTWLARSFCQPVFETWMAEAVATGRIDAPGFFADPLLRWAYTRASWHGDSFGSLNPRDEVAAYVEAVEAGLMTRERAQWELFGDSWADTLPQKARERQLITEHGLQPPAPHPANPMDPSTP